MSNESIQCNVGSCKYNDKKNYCTLDNILVDTTNNLNSCTDKSSTECVSFEPEN